MVSYDGHAFGWDFADHRARTNPATGRRYNGGTDLKHARGEDVLAYVAGIVTAATKTSVIITPDQGDRTQVLELGAVTVSRGDRVYPWTVIGRAGLKWPHFNDLTATGAYVRSAFLNTPYRPPAPDRAEDEEEMSSIRYLFTQDGDKTTYALFGPGQLTGGWRETADKNTAEAWGRLYGASDGGPSVKTACTPAQWAKLKAEAAAIDKDIRAGQTTGGGLDGTGLAAALRMVRGTIEFGQ